MTYESHVLGIFLRRCSEHNFPIPITYHDTFCTDLSTKPGFQFSCLQRKIRDQNAKKDWLEISEFGGSKSKFNQSLSPRVRPFIRVRAFLDTFSPFSSHFSRVCTCQKNFPRTKIRQERCQFHCQREDKYYFFHALSSFPEFFSIQTGKLDTSSLFRSCPACRPSA